MSTTTAVFAYISGKAKIEFYRATVLYCTYVHKKLEEEDEGNINRILNK